MNKEHSIKMQDARRKNLSLKQQRFDAGFDLQI